MISIGKRRGGRLRGLLVLVWVVLLVAPTQSVGRAWAETYATPSGITAVSRASSALAISWSPVRGAENYRIQYADNSTMSGAVYRRSADTYEELNGLQPGKTYYVKVRVITPDGVNLTPYSSAVTISTRSAGDYSLLSPSGLEAAGIAANAIVLTWNSRGTSNWYRIQYSTSPSMTDPVYRRFNALSGTITGLTEGTTYYIRVRAITADGLNLTSYSPAVTSRTTTTTAAPVITLASPTGLTAASRSTSAVALTWKAVSGATNYRVQYADNSAMSNASYRRSTATYTEIDGLTAGRTYYFKVRVIDADGLNLSPYSAAIQADTRASGGYPYLKPLDATLGSVTATSIGLSWASRGSGLSYQVQYATDQAMDPASTKVFSGTSATVTGLLAGTTYYLRVRVSSSGGDGQSEYSTPILSATTRTQTAPLTVASFNVKCANCFSGLANEGTWYRRRDAVVATIREQAPDVLGLQEAAQSWLKDSSGDPIDLAQFEDLIKRLGSPYKLANTKRNNCVKHTTPSSCVYADQGASKGTKIVFNSTKVTLLAQGSKQLSFIDAADNQRFVAWAIFRHLASGKEFFFADTHLEHHDDASGSTAYLELRRKQASEVMATIKAKNTDRLPVILVGDLNAHKWTVPSNGPYDVVVAAGLVDPLGNTYRSTYTAPGATVEARVRTNFATYNGFKRLAPKSAYINGTHLDYIFTSPMRVSEWENVVDIDDSGNFLGVIPSDHNLLQARVHLP